MPSRSAAPLAVRLILLPRATVEALLVRRLRVGGEFWIVAVAAAMPVPPLLSMAWAMNATDPIGKPNVETLSV